MQFQVPQFIEVEDKIFGPLTFKQFIFLAGGAGSVYLFWRIFPLFLAIPFMIAIGGFAVALAFVQYNGRPFLLALETGFNYFMHSKLYLWNNETKHKKARQAQPAATGKQEVYIPKLSNSKLHDLAWSLDIKERLGQGVSDEDDRQMRSPSALVTPGEIMDRLKVQTQ